MDEELRRVVFNGRYTYLTDLPVQLGTRVMLLQTSLLSDPAKVTQIEALCARVAGDPT